MKMLGFSEIKGWTRERRGEGKLKRKGQKVFLGLPTSEKKKKRVILKIKFEKGIFTFKDF